MFLKFKERCRDGKNGALYVKDLVVEFDDDRANEILAKDNGKYAEVVEPIEPAKEAGEDEDREKVVKAMKKDGLVELATEMGLSTDGNKDEIIARILEAEANESERTDGQ